MNGEQENLFDAHLLKSFKVGDFISPDNNGEFYEILEIRAYQERTTNYFLLVRENENSNLTFSLPKCNSYLTKKPF